MRGVRVTSFLSRIIDLVELIFAITILVLERSFRFIITLTFGLVSEELLTKYFSVPTNRNREARTSDHCDENVVQYLRAKGYSVEEHYVRTTDGYILGMQRIVAGRDGKPPMPGTKIYKPVVFMMHGFMQCSEALVVRANPDDSLPMALADKGYDVWLGTPKDVRGSKYSFKHISLKPDDSQFWNFSLDEQIEFDLPSMIQYILDETAMEKISYIGFSQGTALAFAALCLFPKFAKNINVFIALASTALVQGLHNPLVDAVARARPDLIFLMFGRKSFLSSTLFWRKLIGRKLFARMIDFSNRLLFGWRSTQINNAEKPLLYSHLYSYSSVKAVVHWFQIIRTKRFQMFDDTLQAKPSTFYTGHEVPVYPLERITTPVAVFYGGKDNLSDMESLLKIIPNPVMIHKEPDYEHLDFLWAKNTREKIHTPIFKLLEEYNCLKAKENLQSFSFLPVSNISTVQRDSPTDKLLIDNNKSLDAVIKQITAGVELTHIDAQVIAEAKPKLENDTPYDSLMHEIQTGTKLNHVETQ